MEKKTKTLKIPDYWYTDERLQPLVEAETINGNKVMIPQILQKAWMGLEQLGAIILENLDTKQKLERGYQETDSFRRRVSYDLRRLFFEIGQD